MNKQHILDEIRRTASSNGGTPLGRERFFAETGIKETDWRGRYWARWNDAVSEAGFTPNQLNARFHDSAIFEQLVLLCRKLQRFPTYAEMSLERRQNSNFPSNGAIERLGSKHDLGEKLREFCRTNSAYADGEAFLASEESAARPDDAVETTSPDGHVYLIRAGGFYKIGRTNAFGRREREISLQLPEKAITVHVIRTDDPVGIEAYWHRRFESFRRNGEWFDLSPSEVHAFKRRKFM